MKKVLFPLLMFLGTSSICLAQLDICEPDQTYIDSTLGVYPLPFHETNNPLGGISDSACLNQEYQFVFTAVLGDTFKLGGTAYALDSIHISAITGLPQGFGFNTNDSNDTFLKNELGCVVIFGEATDEADLGENELFISAILYTSGFPLPITFPNELIYEGHYYLHVLEGNDSNCLTINVNFQFTSQFGSVRNLPNPFSTLTAIEVESWESGEYEFQVSDLFGQVVHTRSVRIEEGRNRIEFDGSDLPAGLYLYTFSNGLAQVSQKMLICHQ